MMKNYGESSNAPVYDEWFQKDEINFRSGSATLPQSLIPERW